MRKNTLKKDDPKNTNELGQADTGTDLMETSAVSTMQLNITGSLILKGEDVSSYSKGENKSV